MRFKKDSMYSHPVLEQGAEMPSYRDGTISFSVKPQYGRDADGTEVVFCTFNYAVTEPTLSALIEQGKARLGVSIHCREVMSMEAVFIEDNNHVHVIPAGDVTGKTEFTLFVVANEDIDGFTSNNFVEFFEGEYDVQEGAILAFSLPITFYMERESFKAATSIVNLLVDPEATGRRYDFDLRQGTIDILLDKDSHDAVQKARDLKDPHIQALLVNGLYEKGLVAAVAELKKDPEIELPWARVISNMIAASNEIVLNDEAHIVAQHLLKNPMGDFGKALLNVEGDYL
ncbi:hypothetical protein [Mesorhizobium sp. SP-1A]|uniref:hypothetical protein n=1 Tax=Mesorhizobium sp. SP-1A TaxID=3077840 RepID=UPI0028F6FFA4|nr:hypothetical protein [Mesorhizobium sp. SP-1A]